MAEDFLVATAGLLQGIRQHGKPLRLQRASWQGTPLVGGLGQTLHGAVVPREPRWVEGRRWVAWIPEYVTEEDTLRGTLG
jgi:hypothetical protein